MQVVYKSNQWCILFMFIVPFIFHWNDLKLFATNHFSALLKVHRRSGCSSDSPTTSNSLGVVVVKTELNDNVESAFQSSKNDRQNLVDENFGSTKNGRKNVVDSNSSTLAASRTFQELLIDDRDRLIVPSLGKNIFS